MDRVAIRIFAETLSVTPRTSRFTRAARLVRDLIAFHPGYFAVAVTGAAVFAVGTVASSYGVQQLIDRVILPSFAEDDVTFITWLAVSAIVVAIGVARAAGVVVRRSFAGKTQWTTARTIADAVVDRVLRQPPAWHRARMSGDIAARAGVDTDASVAVLAPLPFASSVLVLLVVASTWLIATDPLLGAAAVVVFPLMLIVNLIYQRVVDRYYREAQHQLGALTEAAHESFDAVLVVKAFGAEDRETERLASISRRLRSARSSAVALRASFESMIEATPSMVNIALIALGALRIRAGAMSIGELASFVYLFTLVSFPLRIVSYLFSELPRSLSGWDRVQTILAEPQQTHPASRIEATTNDPANMLELREVWADHEDGKPALRNVSLAVPRGRVMAIVGATGSGKTTLLHVIAGLVPAKSGQVHRATRHVGLVFQEAFLFAESLRYNLTLGREVPDDVVMQSLQAAVALDFVDDLGLGLDTELGERGVSLSGGQRQRLALARALAARSDLLLLDDTTSALDPGTEEDVLNNLKTLGDDTTTLVVASRPSTIALADEVIVMDGGAIVAVGPHEVLLKNDAGYAALISAFENDRAHASETAP